MTERVEVLDSIMGSGKTTAIMKWMKKNFTDRYIYISPLLSEIEDRLQDELPELEFVTPTSTGKGGKGIDFLQLLKDGKNIGTTHSLFKLMTREHMKYISEWGYVVVVDEELEMIRPYSDYTRHDYMWLHEHNFISVTEDHQLVWIDENLPDETRYHQLRAMCDLGMLYTSKRDWSMVTVQLPTELITCAKRVIVLTYLFEGSVFDKFLQMKNIPTAEFNEVNDDLVGVSKEKLRELIEFVGQAQTDKLDETYRNSSFSSTWYTTSANDLSIVSKFIRNVCVAEGMKAEQTMWTAKGSCVEQDGNKRKNGRYVKPSGYTKYKKSGSYQSCWVGCSAKATNLYQDKEMLVHCYNRYPHRTLLAFMQDVGYPIEDGRFALAEMLQWIWRSRIRKGEPIKLAILPKRMRLLFKDWLYNKEA